MGSFLQDCRFSLRLLGRTSGFTTTAIIVLAFGIGANIAIFSLAHELVWSLRPRARPAEVVQVCTQDKMDPKKHRLFFYPTYCDIAAVFSRNRDGGIPQPDSARLTPAIREFLPVVFKRVTPPLNSWHTRC